MPRARVVSSLLTLAFIPLFMAAHPFRSVRAPKVVVVKTVDVSPTEFKFEPANLTVIPGDTVRFTQTTATPHNVEFRAVPAGTNLGSAKMGPFLTTVGATYDVVIDARFATGVHNYVCTPHEVMGMKGTITVAPADVSP